MIEIIGKDTTILKRVTCKNCTSVLQYSNVDVKKDYSTDYTGGRDYYSYVQCPCCGNKVVTRGY